MAPSMSPSPKHQLWHHSRGIAFASASAPSLLPSEPAEQAGWGAVPGHVAVVKTATTTGKKFTSQTYTSKDDVPGGSEKPPAQTEPGKSEDEATAKPPQAFLDFKMSEEAFYAAKRARPGSPESFWSYNMYRGPASEDGLEQKVKIHYCRSKHTMERVCKEYFMDEPVVGFDLEWMADSMKWQGPRKNVSLIQLASPSRVALFHTAVFTDKDISELGPNFRHIMESPDILKVGVAIKGDCTRLSNFFSISSQGLMELSHLYKLVTLSSRGEYKAINRKLVTLATQVQDFLHLPLYKGQDVRGSDWSKPLSMEQIIYSASDAYAGPHLFATLEHFREQLDPCPPRPYPAESDRPIRYVEGVEVAAEVEVQDDATADEAGCKNTPGSAQYVSSVLESITIEEETFAEVVETPLPTAKARKAPSAPKARTTPKASRFF
ncbi:ribonuclease H-like domain-containing protein [Microdochium bolleyi]|uniref:Ribonuclease H-like domain-containing protein n=1 Tax=Microdochium bolleyi TaxID=196109 RepID=A0A136J6P8_9PEZI|nr:ribonuclease H-like domain-containing protein [Microdochium bolleyi]